MSNIPKVFWYSVSLCLLATTAILLYIAIKATSVKIEIANTKIELIQTTSELKSLNAKLELENGKIKEQQRINTLLSLARQSNQKDNNTDFQKYIEQWSKEQKSIEVQPIDPKIFDQMGEKLKALQDSIALDKLTR